MTEATFTIAGLTTFNGKRTIRFANGAPNLRANMLRHKGHEKIDLHELPKPMDKVQATVWVLKNVPGAKSAVIPSRSMDKASENPVLIEAKKRLAATEKARASRDAKKVAVAA